MLEVENGFRQVRTGSAEQAALLAQGYAVHEQDGATTILHRARRATDRRVTTGDLARYREIERRVLEGIASELAEAGVVNVGGEPLGTSQLRWVLDEFRARVMRESGTGRTVVSGRIR